MRRESCGILLDTLSGRIRKDGAMEPGELLGRVRGDAGLTQEELASRAGTSRTTLSAYEHGRKSPTVATFARLLSRAGWDLAAEPHVSFTRQTAAYGKPTWIPDRLPRVDVGRGP